jgi:hypothetical protein
LTGCNCTLHLTAASFSVVCESSERLETPEGEAFSKAGTDNEPYARHL